MNSSDWLQIVLSIVGFVGGAALSFLFFRMQQVTDFKNLNDTITKLAHDISAMKRSTDLGKNLESKDLTNIRENVHTIQVKLEETVIRILNDIKSEQTELRKSLQEKYEAQSKDALIVIERSLRRELDRVLPVSVERDVVIDNMTRLIEQAFIQLGQYQRLNVEQQTSATLSVLEEKVINVIKEVEGKVEGLKQTTEALMWLPAPKTNKPEDR